MKTAILIHLSHGMWKKKDADIYESFEEEAWEAMLPLLFYTLYFSEYAATSSL